MVNQIQMIIKNKFNRFKVNKKIIKIYSKNKNQMKLNNNYNNLNLQHQNQRQQKKD